MQDYEKWISKAYDYIVDVSSKQGHLLPCNILYGDGTRFLPLTRKGFETVYNEIKGKLEVYYKIHGREFDKEIEDARH